jgi:hypothetical protein
MNGVVVRSDKESCTATFSAAGRPLPSCSADENESARSPHHSLSIQQGMQVCEVDVALTNPTCRQEVTLIITASTAKCPDFRDY